MATYRVTFQGEIATGFKPEEVQARVAATFKLSADQAGALFGGARVPVKKTTELATAQKIHDVMRSLGALTYLEEEAAATVATTETRAPDAPPSPAASAPPPVPSVGTIIPAAATVASDREESSVVAPAARVAPVESVQPRRSTNLRNGVLLALLVVGGAVVVQHRLAALSQLLSGNPHVPVVAAAAAVPPSVAQNDLERVCSPSGSKVLADTVKAAVVNALVQRAPEANRPQASAILEKPLTVTARSAGIMTRSSPGDAMCSADISLAMDGMGKHSEGHTMVRFHVQLDPNGRARVALADEKKSLIDINAAFAQPASGDNPGTQTARAAASSGTDGRDLKEVEFANLPTTFMNAKLATPHGGMTNAFLVTFYYKVQQAMMKETSSNWNSMWLTNGREQFVLTMTSGRGDQSALLMFLFKPERNAAILIDAEFDGKVLDPTEFAALVLSE